MRDAWRQHRLYMLYDGNPPIEIIEQQQGVNDEDTDKLLQEQQQWENQQKK